MKKKLSSVGLVISLMMYLTIGLGSATAVAGPGHDHGDETPVVVGEATPRFVMSSDLFDVVGILTGKTLVIYVDHAKTNEPVQNATVELELNGNKVPVELHADGEFDALLPEEINSSQSKDSVSVAMTISAGESVDILAGDLSLSQTHEENDATHSHILEFALYSGAAFLVLIAASVWIKRRKLLGGK